jgi:predicted membrane-bound spermidine synthase
MALPLTVIFFLSGCAALLFETLWFRQAGLALGSSIWSSSLVLAAFMAGLGLGNAWAARRGAGVRQPLRLYARLELLIALTGLLVALGLPWLGTRLAPLFARAVDAPLWLGFGRLAIAFLLMLLPAAAMGATLPVMVRALGASRRAFGTTLGLLYGVNTLGAMTGALVGESLLIERFGVTGTALCAALLNVIAAGTARALAPRVDADASGSADAAVDEPAPAGAGAGLRALLAAAGLAGALLLALEVIWFRYLLLFVNGSSTMFAIMLAVVLAGIGLGGLLASRWLERQPEAAAWAPVVALSAAASVALAHHGFRTFVLGQISQYAARALDGLHMAVWLMLPTCVLSGLLFTLLGQALRQRLRDGVRAAGLLTLANTIGATLGSLAGGFLLLPSLGVEASLFVLAALYAVLVPLTRQPGATAPRLRFALLAALALAATALATFPFGSLRTWYVGGLIARWSDGQAEVAAMREGLNETVVYLRHTRWGQPIAYRMMTNGFSMSGSRSVGERYMRLFAYWPLALHPRATSALQISYGVGVTADALTQGAHLRRIDIVDISPDVMALAGVPFPRPARRPLEDPRVRLHIEDGRFFLATTTQRFDVITAEPPPPKNAGVVNLYSREHFELIHARLAPGGLATYWLPVQQLSLADGQAITAAFCAAFPDCTLWSGIGPELMLAGSRDAQAATEEGLHALWDAPLTSASLRAIGLASPEQLGTTFVADAEQLQTWLGGTPPVEDEHPYRLSPAFQQRFDVRWWELADPLACQERFARSAWVRRIWPAALRAATLERFPREAHALRLHWTFYRVGSVRLADMVSLMRDTPARTSLLWATGWTPDIEAAARQAGPEGARPPDAELTLGAVALADGDYAAAEQHLRRAQPHLRQEQLAQWRVMAAALAGERERAQGLLREAGDWLRPFDTRGWAFLTQHFGLTSPWPETGEAAAGVTP